MTYSRQAGSKCDQDKDSGPLFLYLKKRTCTNFVPCSARQRQHNSGSWWVGMSVLTHQYGTVAGFERDSFRDRYDRIWLTAWPFSWQDDVISSILNIRPCHDDTTCHDSPQSSWPTYIWPTSPKVARNWRKMFTFSIPLPLPETQSWKACLDW